MNKKYGFLSMLFLFFFIACVSWAQVPRTISYQGVLLDNNKNPKPDGNYAFIFKLYDSKDVGTGNQMGNYQQTSSVKVENGVFSALLDFTTFPNLKFDNPLWLDITVNGEQLSQRVMLASSAYALGIADGSVTTPKIVDGAVTEGKLADNSVSTSKLQDNSVSTNKIQDNAVSTSKIQDNAVSNLKLQDGSVSTTKLQDNAVNTYKLVDGIVLSQLFIRGYDDDPLNFGYLGNIVDLNTGKSLGGGLFIFDQKGVDINNVKSGNAIAGITGDGAVWGKTKNFIDIDPTNPSRKIRYTSIEGPEAAMYVRGKANLVNGRAIIKLPEHFSALAVASSITVTLTPRSFNSKGLATGKISSNAIEVGELFNGTGSYEFDYVVYAVRKGYEDYKVYLDPNDLKSLMVPSPGELNSGANKKVSK
jgi:hypothetical protein